MEEVDKKNVVCLNCGHTWETNAKRPQCSICKSVRVEEVDKVDKVDSANVEANVDVESTDSASVDDFFELDDSAINKLIEDKPKKKSKRKKNKEKEKRDEQKNNEAREEEIGEKKGFSAKFSIKRGFKAIGSKVGTGVIAVGVLFLFLIFILRGIGERKSKKMIQDVDVQDQGFDPYSALG
jgi:hypothetical protein